MKTEKLKSRLRLLCCLVILQCMRKHLTTLETSLPPQLQGQGQGAQVGRGWELLGCPAISRMGLELCWVMLTHVLYTLHAQLAPLLEERSMVLLGPNRTLKVLERKGRKQDGLGAISTLNIESKQLHDIISLCHAPQLMHSSMGTCSVSSIHLICFSPPHAFLKVNCRYSRIFFSPSCYQF